MVQAWISELGEGLLRFFMNPILYYGFIIAFLIGLNRVKRERKDFHIRVFDTYRELASLLPLGILIGLILSIVMIGVGVVIPFGIIVLVAITTFLLSLTTKIRLLSPAYIIGVAFFAATFIGKYEVDVPLFGSVASSLDQAIFPTVAILLAMLMIAEGFLIIKSGAEQTSPKIVKSKRGYPVGVHESKRLWMLPMVLLVPNGLIELPFEWWPVFSIGESSYTLFIVPFLIGFAQQVQGMLPREGIKNVGGRVLFLGIVSLGLAIGSNWYSLLAIITVALAMVGREVLTVRQRMQEEDMPFYFSKQAKGLMILGVIPNSPAEKMVLQVGEVIVKVNGTYIDSEEQFYLALQRNRAHCKLEVIDVNGQIRFVQRALYEGDHHELGILFVQSVPVTPRNLSNTTA